MPEKEQVQVSHDLIANRRKWLEDEKCKASELLAKGKGEVFTASLVLPAEEQAEVTDVAPEPLAEEQVEVADAEAKDRLELLRQEAAGDKGALEIMEELVISEAEDKVQPSS